MAFDLVDDSLQKYLHALNTESVEHIETPQDRGRVAVEKIQVGDIDYDIVAGFGMDLDTDPLQQACIVAEHIALDPQGSYSADVIIDLIDLCCHVLKD